MKEFQSIILKFVKNHERHKKYLAFLMALFNYGFFCSTVQLNNAGDQYDGGRCSVCR